MYVGRFWLTLIGLPPSLLLQLNVPSFLPWAPWPPIPTASLGGGRVENGEEGKSYKLLEEAREGAPPKPPSMTN